MQFSLRAPFQALCLITRINPIEAPDWSWWFLTGIWHSYWEYDNYKRRSASITDIGFTTNFNTYLQTQETWLAVCESDRDTSIFFNMTYYVEAQIVYLTVHWFV